MDASGVDKNSDQYRGLQREIASTEAELGKLEKAARNSNAVMSKISAVASEISDATGRMADKTRALSGAAAGGLAALGGAAYKSVTRSDDLNTMSAQSGFSTADIQAFDYAADRIDVSTDDIISSAKKLKKNMGSTSEDVTKAFEKLSVAVKDENGNFRDSTEVFWDVANALSAVPNETERDILAMTLFGKSADSLAGIIDDGGQAFRDLKAEAENLDLIIPQETLDQLNETNDKIDKIKAQFEGTAAVVGAKFAEVIEPIFEKVAAKVEDVLEWLGSLDEDTLGIIATVLLVVAAISPLLSLISGITGAVSALSAVLTFLAANPVVLIIAGVVALVAAFIILWNKCEGFRNFFIAAWDAIKSAAESVWNWLKGAVEDIGNFFKGIGEKAGALKDAVSEKFTAIKDAMSEKIGAAKEAVSEKLDNIRNAFNEKGGGIKGVAAAVMEGVKGYFSLGFAFLNKLTGGKLGQIVETFRAKLQAIKDKVTTIMDGVKSKFQTVIDKIKGLFSGLKLNFPKIKIPHFTITPQGWKIGDLLEGSIPKLGISWYAKAMPHAMLLDSPTIFGAANGKLLGGGEAGREVVAGASTLMHMMTSAFRQTLSQMQSANVLAYRGAAQRQNGDLLEAIRGMNGGTGGIVQTINFNQPVQTPDETARAVDRVLKFGLLGGNA